MSEDKYEIHNMTNKDLILLGLTGLVAIALFTFLGIYFGGAYLLGSHILVASNSIVAQTVFGASVIVAFATIAYSFLCAGILNYLKSTTKTNSLRPAVDCTSSSLPLPATGRTMLNSQLVSPQPQNQTAMSDGMGTTASECEAIQLK